MSNVPVPKNVENYATRWRSLQRRITEIKAKEDDWSDHEWHRLISRLMLATEHGNLSAGELKLIVNIYSREVQGARSVLGRAQT